jgi:hypothetical protein
MDIQALAGKVQRLEDLEEIKQLKYKYSLGCDQAINIKDGSLLLTVFTPEIVWDGGAFGVVEGLEGMKGLIAAMPEQIKFTYHFFTNPILEIDGDTATGHWNLWGIYTFADGNDMVLSAIEEDVYKKVDGKWLIDKLTVKTAFLAPYKEGWSKIVTGAAG